MNKAMEAFLDDAIKVTHDALNEKLAATNDKDYKLEILMAYRPLIETLANAICNITR